MTWHILTLAFFCRGSIWGTISRVALPVVLRSIGEAAPGLQIWRMHSRVTAEVTAVKHWLKLNHTLPA